MKNRPEDFAWRVFLYKNYPGALKATEETALEWVPIKNLGNFHLLPNILDVVKATLDNSR